MHFPAALMAQLWRNADFRAPICSGDHLDYFWIADRMEVNVHILLTSHSGST